MKRFAKLDPQWLMRGWRDVKFALVNRISGEVRPFDDRFGYVLRSCDGTTDFESPAFLPLHRRILDALIRQNVVAECEPDHGLDALQRFRAAHNPYVKSIHWSVTGTCNLRCIHCYVEAPGERYKDMTAPEIERIIEQFAQANIMQVSITGGEPFHRPDLFPILEKMTKAGIHIPQIYTNGLLVTDKILQQVREAGIAPEFHMSFDGCGFHDRMRGLKGAEERTVEAIRLITEAGFLVFVTSCIDEVANECLIPTYELLKSLGVKAWKVGAPISTGNWRKTQSALRDPSDMDTNGVTDSEGHIGKGPDKVYGPVLNRWKRDGRPFQLQLDIFYNSALDTSKANPAEGAQCTFTPDSPECGSCTLTSYLLPDGSLIPCHAFTGTGLARKMPNIRETDLSDILTDSLLTTFSRAAKWERLAHNPECRGCDLFQRCGMGCRARAYTETGDLNGKDPVACELLKSRFHGGE